MSIIQDFKAFALKGNVIDMAVGVIIGSAFGKIVSSLVNDVLMPVIGMLTGNIDFTNLSFQLGEGENAAVLKYGQFIQNVTDFLIIAICIFFMVKGISALSRKKEEELVSKAFKRVVSEIVRALVFFAYFLKEIFRLF